MIGEGGESEEKRVVVDTGRMSVEIEMVGDTAAVSGEVVFNAWIESPLQMQGEMRSRSVKRLSRLVERGEIEGEV